MIKLTKLVEGKQVGTLYHFTSIDNFMDIMDNNLLKHSKAKEKNPKTGKQEDNISFTRDKRFGKAFRPGVDVDVAFVVDGNKLSDKYKISPYQFDFDAEGMFDLPQEIRDEMEEKIWVRVITNFKKYVTGVIINTKSKGLKRRKWDEKQVNQFKDVIKKKWKLPVEIV